MALQTSLRVQKRLLRKSVNTALDAIPRESIDSQSNSITEKVLSLPQFRGSKGISCFLSMPTAEVNTSALISSILCHPDQQLFVPKIMSKDGVMDFLQIFNESDLSSLPSGTWGIKEPDSRWEGRPRLAALTADEPVLDIVVLPGVAFDRTLSRLGHGKGYYDRFISTYVASGKPKPLLVGLSLREQFLDSGLIPMGNLDWQVDIVVTPDEVLTANDQVGQ